MPKASDAAKGGDEAAFGRWSDPVLLLGLMAVWLAIAIVFNGEPQIDVGVSGWFFSPEACADGTARLVCGSFPLSASGSWGTLRNIFHYLPMVCAIVVAVLLARDLMAGRGIAAPRPLRITAALAALALGPGLLVNAFLKEWWGRPRPSATDLFGGDLPFVPAGQWSDACSSNCSFVSGEASTIFWLVCLIPLLPARWRASGGAAIIIAASLGALLRVAFGGHYLSDVVLGGLSTVVVFSAVACLADWWVARKRVV